MVYSYHGSYQIKFQPSTFPWIGSCVCWISSDKLCSTTLIDSTTNDKTVIYPLNICNFILGTLNYIMIKFQHMPSFHFNILVQLDRFDPFPRLNLQKPVLSFRQSAMLCVHFFKNFLFVFVRFFCVGWCNRIFNVLWDSTFDMLT